MSLAFIDGADHYATADILKKWNAASVYGGLSVLTAATRTGLNGLRATNFRFGAQKNIDAGHATVILGAAVRVAALSAIDCLFAFVGPSGTTHGAIGMTASGLLTAMRGVPQNSGVLIGTSATGLTANTWAYVEVKYTLSDTVGVVEVRVNGATVLNLTAVDTKNGSTDTTLTSVSLLSPNGSSTVNLSTAINVDFDDIYICTGAGAVNNDFLGDVKVDTLLPTAAGASTQFTSSVGANFAAVDEAAMNTTDFVTSSAVGQIDTYALGDLVTAGGSIKGVQTNVFAQKTDAGAQGVEPIVRIGAVNYLQGEQALPFGSWELKRAIADVSPATGVAWTVAEVNALEAGFASRT